MQSKGDTREKRRHKRNREQQNGDSKLGWFSQRAIPTFSVFQSRCESFSAEASYCLICCCWFIFSDLSQKSFTHHSHDNLHSTCACICTHVHTLSNVGRFGPDLIIIKKSIHLIYYSLLFSPFTLSPQDRDTCICLCVCVSVLATKSSTKICP